MRLGVKFGRFRGLMVTVIYLFDWIYNFFYFLHGIPYYQLQFQFCFTPFLMCFDDSYRMGFHFQALYHISACIYSLVSNSFTLSLRIIPSIFACLHYLSVPLLLDHKFVIRSLYRLTAVYKNCKIYNRAMYNGIGLQSARGSGTSGYVQKNLSTSVKKFQSKEDFLK